MLVLDLFSFNSLRIFALISHFFLTTVLIWMEYNSITITLNANFSRGDYHDVRQQYTGLISCGLGVLIAQFYFIGSSTNKLSIGTTLNLLLDAIACFFIAWIILDGLDWRTYIYILVFCVILPALWNVFSIVRFRMKNVWVKRTQRTSFWEDIDAIGSSTSTGIVYICTNAGSALYYAYDNFWPALCYIFDVIGAAYFEVRQWLDRCLNAWSVLLRFPFNTIIVRNTWMKWIILHGMVWCNISQFQIFLTLYLMQVFLDSFVVNIYRLVFVDLSGFFWSPHCELTSVDNHDLKFLKA